MKAQKKKLPLMPTTAAWALRVGSVLLLSFDALDSMINNSNGITTMSLFRRLEDSCETFFTGVGYRAYWENFYSDIYTYPGQDRTLPGGPNTIAFVVPMVSCPEDVAFGPQIISSCDPPGHSLYDAAAVLKHSIDTNLALTGKYKATFHAMFHQDAIHCIGPNGNLYDRVKVVESLGYYANIKDSPINLGSNDLTRLYAFEYEESAVVGKISLQSLGYSQSYTHALPPPNPSYTCQKPSNSFPHAVLTDFDTVFNSAMPLDHVIDTFISSTAEIAFDPSAAAADVSMIMLKPDTRMVDILAEEYASTSLEPVNAYTDGGEDLGTAVLIHH